MRSTDLGPYKSVDPEALACMNSFVWKLGASPSIGVASGEIRTKLSSGIEDIRTVAAISSHSPLGILPLTTEGIINN